MKKQEIKNEVELMKWAGSVFISAWADANAMIQEGNRQGKVLSWLATTDPKTKREGWLIVRVA